MPFNLHRTRQKIAALASLAALGGAAHAAVALPPDLLTTFTRCDAGFFEQLSRVPEIEQLGPVERSPGFVDFRVPDRGNSKHNRQVFPYPVETGGLTLTGYENSYGNLGWHGRAWFWGFIIQGSPAQVLETLPATLRATMQRSPSGKWEKIERMDLRGGARIWTPLGIEHSNMATDQDTVERGLILGPDGKTGNSLLQCTVQGFPDAGILQQLRPDAWRQFTDPAYLHRQQQLIDQILASDTSFYLPENKKSDAALRQQAHRQVRLFKRQYQAAGDHRPPAFWSAMTQMQYQWLQHMQHPTDASNRMKRQLRTAMQHYADNADLEEIAKQAGPTWAVLIASDVMASDTYWKLWQQIYVTDALAFLAPRQQKITKRFGELHLFPSLLTQEREQFEKLSEPSTP